MTRPSSRWRTAARSAPSPIGLAPALRLAAAALVAGGISAGPAFALDPAREIHQYVRRVWTTQDGLPQNSVNAILQTRDGYLWLGTFGGLARFDGVRVTAYDEANDSGLAGSRILALYEDRDGGLWVGTEDAGAARIQGGRFTRFTTEQGLPSNLVWTLHQDRAGTIWAGTRGGLARFSGDRFVADPPADQLPEPNVVALAEDSEDRLWIGTLGGLAQRTGGKLQIVHAAAGSPPLAVQALVPDPQGGIWVRTRNRITRLRDGKFMEDLAVPLPASSIAAPVLRDRDGNVWFSGQGLSRLSAGKISTLTVADGLPELSIRALYEDREGNLWVGTDGGGLLRLRDSAVTQYGAREGLPRSVLPIIEDANGTVWIGGSCGGLWRWDAGRITELLQADRRPFACVGALLAGRDGSLWIGHGTLTRLRRGVQSSLGLADGLPDQNVRALHEAADGTIWIGTGAGLTRYQDGVMSTYTTRDGLVDPDVRFITEDRSGRLWVGTRGGISRLEGDRFVNLTVRDGLPHGSVRAIHESPDGVFWVGTYGGGLARLDGARITRYETKDGLLDQVVSRILEDDRGHFWLSGLRGVAEVPRRELEEFATGQRDRIAPIPYGLEDGMPTAECNGGGQPAGWRGRDGRMWFPTIRGVAVVDPQFIRRNPTVPPVAIEEVLVNRRATQLTPPAVLPAGRTDLEVRYTGLSLGAPERLRFRYRLEGFDDDWIDAGSRRAAYYTNLPPGHYRFVVTAANSDGIWNPAAKSVAFSLRPRLYQTPWFLAASALALAVVAGGGYRLRTRQLASRQRELEALVKTRTRELWELNSYLEERVASKTEEIRGTRDMAVFALARLAELRDATTAEHLERIGAYSRRLAEALAARPGAATASAAFLDDLARSSPLHDIGKVAIPDHILRKPGRLTPEEEAVMRTHTTIGGDTLRDVLRSHQGHSFLALAMEIAYGHHERWDGTGYPNGVSGTQIPLAARIVTLVDAYDAVTSARPYKPALDHAEAVRRIVADRGRHFDPDIVDAFLDIHEDFQRIRRQVETRGAA